MKETVYQRDWIDSKEIIIRKVKVEDAAQLIALEKTIAEDSIFMMPEPSEVNMDIKAQENNLQQVLSNPLQLYVVAEFGGEVVGFLLVVVQDLKRIRHVGNFIIGLEKKSWGLGISKRLMEVMFEWSKQMDLKRIEMDVVEDNVRAIGLYEKFGFEIEGKKIKDYYVGDGIYLSTLMMGINLE